MKAIRPEAIRAHIRFLSDSLLEGRAPGTKGYDIAAAYVASELESMGLRPAGVKGGCFSDISRNQIAQRRVFVPGRDCQAHSPFATFLLPD